MNGAEGVAMDGLLGSVRWGQVFSSIWSEPLYGSLIGSGLLLTAGLVARFMAATWSIHGGARPDFYAPLLRLALFALVLANYRQLCSVLLNAVVALGEASLLRPYELEQIWRARHEAYAAHVVDVTNESLQQWSAQVTAINACVELLAHLLLLLSHAAIFALRALQVFVLVLLFLAGPWMLALAFLGGPFVGLAWGWLLGLLEVASWSWGCKVLAFSMHQVLQATAVPEYTFSREIAVNAAMVVLVAAVPLVMGRLWRGQTTRRTAQNLVALTHHAEAVGGRP